MVYLRGLKPPKYTMKEKPFPPFYGERNESQRKYVIFPKHAGNVWLDQDSNQTPIIPESMFLPIPSTAAHIMDKYM